MFELYSSDKNYIEEIKKDMAYIRIVKYAVWAKNKLPFIHDRVMWHGLIVLDNQYSLTVLKRQYSEVFKDNMTLQPTCFPLKLVKYVKDFPCRVEDPQEYGDFSYLPDDEGS